MRIPKGNASVRAGALALALGLSAVLVTAIPASAATTVTSFTPTCGPVGTSVTITGTGFSGPDAVNGVIFNGTNATTWAVVNDTTATATVPAGAITGYILVSTPGSDESSHTSFTVTSGACGVPAGQHDRSITLVLKNHLTAKGRVTVGDGFNDCRTDAAVKIQRKKGSTWKTVGTDQTTGVGNYRVSVPDKPGKYRASIKKTELNGGDDTCGADTSATVNHRH